VQGASHAGARHVIAVDPVEFKRETAMNLGATHAFASIDEASDFGRSVTFGQGADAAIVTVGILKQEHILQAFRAIRKAGTVVVTGVGNFRERIDLPAWELVFFQKRLQGALFGASSPSRDIPWLLDMYRSGQLRLDEVITTRYSLDDINIGYADMHAGVNIRGIIDY
jgi:S-(hydroxymethyl)glutathione dehydrogenase/alcohol dehydrogenase